VEKLRNNGGTGLRHRVLPSLIGVVATFLKHRRGANAVDLPPLNTSEDVDSPKLLACQVARVNLHVPHRLLQQPHPRVAARRRLPPEVRVELRNPNGLPYPTRVIAVGVEKRSQLVHHSASEHVVHALRHVGMEHRHGHVDPEEAPLEPRPEPLHQRLHVRVGPSHHYRNLVAARDGLDGA